MQDRPGPVGGEIDGEDIRDCGRSFREDVDPVRKVHSPFGSVRIGSSPKTHAAVIFSARAGSLLVRLMAAMVRVERSAKRSGYCSMVSLRRTRMLMAAVSHFPGDGRSDGTATPFSDTRELGIRDHRF